MNSSPSLSFSAWLHETRAVVHLAAPLALSHLSYNELTVEFTVLGRAFLGLNGGPAFSPNEAVSLMVLTENQEETDRYWDAVVGNGGKESDCGWCKDRWGVSWQITPKRLMELITGADRNKAKRAFAAMMTMQKIDIARIEAAAEAA